jgi:methylthioribose-1-phosphate isomerase
MMFTPISYEKGKITLIDQTRLPEKKVLLICKNVEDLWQAIKCLAVRGAPLLGVTAAYGICLGIDRSKCKSVQELGALIERVAAYIGSSRPTAVNLFWALNRMKKCFRDNDDKSLDQIKALLHAEAEKIYREDLELSKKIGEAGNAIINDGDTILTHCNAGGLATSGYGTALAVMFTAHDKGKKIHVFADETRPLLQGARLTAWELKEYGIPVTLICDNMAAVVMREGKINKVITGADRIAANGDAANKIGTYGVAVLAKHHGIPFYIAAPYSTFDLSIASGQTIVIEERAPEEVSCGFGKRTAPEGIHIYNPAFDVTPAELITGIITEKGILKPPYKESIQ